MSRIVFQVFLTACGVIAAGLILHALRETQLGQSASAGFDTGYL